MNSSTTCLSVALMALSLAACSSNDEPGSEQAPSSPDSADRKDCDPEGEIPCYEGVAEPCKDYETPFKGDEYCLAPPDPSLGIQMHVGPEDYDDPEATEPYMIYPGEETNWSEVKAVGNEETFFTRGYHSHMRPGSHHFIMFGVSDVAPSGPTQAGAGTESAVGAVGGEFLAGATRSVQNIDTIGEHPEDQGIGNEFPAGRVVANNLHFINLEEEPLLQELWVNFIYIDESEVTRYVKPITWYGGILMNVAPGAHVTLAGPPATCTAPGDVRVGMMTAHAHASTLRVTTTMRPAGAENETVLFEDYDWHEPTEWRYNRGTVNPAPDAATKTSGGFSGLVEAKPGDEFRWECEVRNEQNVSLTFGNRLLTGEMCNVFGFYFTEERTARPWSCVFM